MKKTIISGILALILCFSLTVCVSAEPKAIDFVVDEVGYLAGGELDLLCSKALTIYEERGVGIFFVYTTEDDLESYDVSLLVGGIEDHYVMIENETSWCSFSGGSAQEHIDTATEDRLRDVYDQADTYVGGVSEFLDAAAACFPTGTEDAPQGDAPEAGERVLMDGAELLSDAEEAALTQKLLDVSHTYQAQIAVVTVASTDGTDTDRFIRSLYDGLGFGYGDRHDGVLLLVSMDPREYRILSNGAAAPAIGSDEIEAIGEKIAPDLSDGDHAAAFDGFVERCVYYLDGHQNGFPFAFGKNLLISLVIGIVAGLIVAFVLKGQLKTVRKQDKANVYVKKDSMEITDRSDIFLYREVSRSKKSSSDSSSGSGSSRNTGGGSF